VNLGCRLAGAVREGDSVAHRAEIGCADAGIAGLNGQPGPPAPALANPGHCE
jgi:hypothetical protein